MSRERIDFDVVVVGAGPAGLGAACRLGQLARAAGRELKVAVVEKGSAVGAHIVSGALFEPRALRELFPDWRERGAPLGIRVVAERIDWLTSARRRVRVPAVFAALGVDGAAADAELDRYAERIRASWLWEELYRGRNFSAGLARLGTLGGGALAFLEQNLLRGRSPWTLRNRTEDHARLRDAAHARRLTYAKPDEPAQRYCPAGVYEIATGADGAARLQINATNCVHCKTCDIKDPSSNVTWLPPEGGGGPHYSGM